MPFQRLMKRRSAKPTEIVFPKSHHDLFNTILGWVDQLSEVDTSAVEPMTAVIPQALRLRDDVIDADPLTGGGIRDKVLANAPAPEHGFFGVPKVIE